MNFKANESAAKLRGGYYTPPELAAFLLRWVREIQPERLLEPSCGDGAFFRTLSRLSAPSICSVTGFEIEPSEAARARTAGEALDGVSVDVHTRDFLGWALTRLSAAPAFDAVVGNPPFIRYQYLDGQGQANAEAIHRAFRLPFTKHTNAWVPFVIASVALLRPGGRLAMVVPAELLHVLHAQSLRSFLIRTCSRVLVLDLEELWFEGALQGAALLLAERAPEPGQRGSVAVQTVSGRDFLDGDPDALFNRAGYIDGEAVARKWMPALLTRRERDALADVARRDGVYRFTEVAQVDVGIVTGANKFFLVPDSVVRYHELERWAHPMFGRSEHVPGVIYDEATHAENRRSGLPTNFLWFRPEDGALSAAARRYVGMGEAERLHTRYKCRIRSPWYTVPSVYAAPVAMLKRCHHYPRLVLNAAEALTTDTAYRIRPAAGIAPERLVGSFVNSLTALSAELEGRHYGGGVLELVPSEIERVLVPLPDQHDAPHLRQLDARIRSGEGAEAVLAAQDARVLGALGVGAPERAELRAAWSRLRSRRQRVEATAEAQETSM